MDLLLAGVPNGYWYALHFETGKPVSENGQATWATKKIAVDWINSHRGNANDWMFLQLPHDGIPRSWQSLAVSLRICEQVELYHRANGDGDLHVHIPTDPAVNAAGYANE